MANDVNARLIVQILANNADFIKGVGASQKQLSSFVNGVKKVAGAVGIAFSAERVISFAAEITRLAGEAEGVENAFNKLPGSIKLMDDMKRATGGTVSELNLMKRAVQAANFDISLQSLPKLLEFAAVRAQQTGQSVDYLVDSIVTGIGRKSPLILDNLGISASQLREEMNGVSLASASVGEVAEAVGRIAGTNLEQMGTLADTASTKTERLAASWENLKVAIGDASNEAGLFGSTVDILTQSLDFAAQKSLSFWEKLGAIIQGPGGVAAASLEALRRNAEAVAEEERKQAQVIREVDRAYKEFNGNLEAYAATIQTHVLRTELLAEFQRRLNEEAAKSAGEIVNIKNLTEKLNTLLQERLTLTGAQLAATNDEIKAIRAQIKALEELSNTIQKVPDAPQLMSLDIASPDLDIRGDEGQRLFESLRSIIPDKPFVIPVEVEFVESVPEEFAKKILDDLEATRVRAADTFLQLQNIISGSVQSAIQGEQQFAQALAGITLDIVDMFVKQALAAAISKSITTPGVPLPVGLALAGVAVAAVKGLLSKHVGSTRGGSGGGSSVSPRSSQQTFATERASVQLLLGGEFKVRNNDLVLALDKGNIKRQRIG